MRLVRLMLVVGLVLLFANVGFAQTIDPSIIILGSGPIGTVSIPGSTFSFFTNTGSDCNFTSPPGAAGDCTISNNNTGGGNWIAVSFLISQTVSPANVICNTTQVGSLFANCVVTQVGGVTDPTMVTLSGGPGIPLGTEALIAISGWTPGSTFGGTVTLTPEPASIALLLTGGGFLLARRKLRKIPRS